MTGAPTAAELARVLDLKRVGSTWRGGCPHCGGSRRFSLREGNRGPLLWCWGCNDSTAILAELRRRGVWPQPERREFSPAERRQWAAAKSDAQKFQAWLTSLEYFLRDSGGAALARFHLAWRLIAGLGLDYPHLPMAALADACASDEEWLECCDRLRDYIARAPAAELLDIWRGLHQTRRAA